MAHGFRNLGVNTTFASKRELAWHKLGKVVDAMTSAEAIKLGGMDFEVALAPIYLGVSPLQLEETFEYKKVIRDGNDKDVKFFQSVHFPTSFGTYRTDNNIPFGIVGSRYEVIQNFEAFDFFDSIIGAGHAEYETVGALGDGEKVFITAKMPSKLLVNKEEIDKYLLLTMAHDGTSSIQALFTPVRVVCNNTLSAALNGATNKIAIRHTKNAREKLENAKKLLGIAELQSKYMEQAFNVLAKTELTESQIIDVICNSFGFSSDEDGRLSTKAFNVLEKVMEYHDRGIGQEGIQGTGWGVYNAITGYQQNVQTYRDANLEFNSINNDTVARVRQKALNELLAFI